MTTDKQAPEDTVPLSTALRRFLDAAGGEVLVLDGVDAGDLYVSLYGYELPPKPAMIAGTRISVSAIQSFHKAGYDTAGIIAEYPDLTEADVKAALAAQPAPAVPPEPGWTAGKVHDLLDLRDVSEYQLHMIAARLNFAYQRVPPAMPEPVGIVQALSICGTPMPNSTGVEWFRSVPAGAKLYIEASVPPAPEAPSTEAALRQALEKISALDPAKDSVEGFDEWGQADCFEQAQNIAHDALAAPATQPAPAVPLADDDDYSIANCIAWLDAKYRRHGEYEDKAAAEHLRRAAPPPAPAVPPAMPKPVAWRMRINYQDDDPGWGNWRVLSDFDVQTYQSKVAERPERYEVQPLYTAPPPEPAAGEDRMSELLHAEMDRDYYRALVDGSWPTADEVIAYARQQRRDAIAAAAMSAIKGAAS